MSCTTQPVGTPQASHPTTPAGTPPHTPAGDYMTESEQTGLHHVVVGTAADHCCENKTPAHFQTQVDRVAARQKSGDLSPSAANAKYKEIREHIRAEIGHENKAAHSGCNTKSTAELNHIIEQIDPRIKENNALIAKHHGSTEVTTTGGEPVQLPPAGKKELEVISKSLDASNKGMDKMLAGIKNGDITKSDATQNVGGLKMVKKGFQEQIDNPNTLDQAKPLYQKAIGKIDEVLAAIDSMPA
jgi:hypothetical protein